jgi:hypothetical protein
MATAEIQFSDRQRFPVSAEVTADGWATPGIAFEDYARMAIQTHKLSGERRLPTPRWAINNEMLRLLIVSFLEERMLHAGSKFLWTYWRAVAKLPLEKRLEIAQKRLMEQRPWQTQTLDALCKEYVGASPERKQILQTQIQNVDTFLRYTEKDAGLATIAGCVSLYYRYCTDSVGVGLELHLKPNHVRQILCRLFETARKLSVIDPRFIDGASAWYQRRWNRSHMTRPPSNHSVALTYRNEAATLIAKSEDGRVLKILNAKGEAIWVESKAVVVDFAQTAAA